MKTTLKSLILSTLIVSAVFLSSCADINRVRGGNIKVEQTTKALNSASPIDKNPPKTYTVEVGQPDNAKQPAEVHIKFGPDGTPSLIDANTGTTQDVAGILSAISKVNLLNPLIWIGAGLIVMGVVLAVVVKKPTWGLYAGGTGIGLIVGSYLLAQYSGIFLILGLIAVLAFVGFFLYDHFVLRRANLENIDVVDELKKYLDPSDLNRLFLDKDATVKKMQSKTTQKVVKTVLDKKVK